MNALQYLSVLTKALVDMETGYRGFLLTGEDASLEPYEAGKKRFSTSEGALAVQVRSTYDVSAARSHLEKARALAQDADLYLMDEPFAGVDAASEQVLVSALRTLQAEGKTVLVVHHDLQTAPDYFDHALILATRAVASGPPGRSKR